MLRDGEIVWTSATSGSLMPVLSYAEKGSCSIWRAKITKTGSQSLASHANGKWNEWFCLRTGEHLDTHTQAFSDIQPENPWLVYLPWCKTCLFGILGVLSHSISFSVVAHRIICFVHLGHVEPNLKSMLSLACQQPNHAGLWTSPGLVESPKILCSTLNNSHRINLLHWIDLHAHARFFKTGTPFHSVCVKAEVDQYINKCKTSRAFLSATTLSMLDTTPHTDPLESRAVEPDVDVSTTK